MKYGFKMIMIALLFALTGCVASENEIDAPMPNDGREATLTVSVPGMRAPSTRALDAAKEKEIEELNVVIIRTADNTLLEHYRVGGSGITAAGGANDWQFKVQGVVNTSGITLAVIANASVEVAKALDALNGTWRGAAKADFLAALEAASDAGWKTSATGYWTIPMYGEAVVSGSIFDGVPTVHLTRMLAKVDVANNATTGPTKFSLTAVHVVNHNTGGRIAPEWNTSGIINTSATTPNLPADPGQASANTPLTYTTTTQALTNEIYLFESAALSDNPATPDGLRLVFEGDFTDASGTAHYYYPVDFMNGSTYIPVLRNNRYRFTITSAAGRGYDGFAEAVAAAGLPSSLRTKLHIVDESGITNTVWNGEHFLGAGEPETFEKSSGSKSIPVTTNHDDGWQIDTSKGGGTGIVYTNGSGWLTATKDGAAGDLSAELLLSVASNASERYVNSITNSSAPRTATVHLKAGRLTQTVTVTQEKYIIAPEFAHSNVVLYIDGDGNRILTFAETPEDHTAKTVTYANRSGGNRTVTFDGATALKANVQGIHFRWGGMVGLSSSNEAKNDTRFNGANDIKFWPEEYEATCMTNNGGLTPDAVTWKYTQTPTQWSDPTQVPYLGDQTINNNAANHDAFITQYPGVGYDAATGYGDICRYMSDMDWVEGNWRLPTQREVYLLDSETKAAVSGGVVYGTFQSDTEWTYIAADNPMAVGSPYYGFTRIPNARLLGGGITAADAADPDYLAEGGENRVLLPAGGNRHSSDGNQYRVGYNGLYWTSTPGSSASYGGYLWITGNAFNVDFSNSRSFGCAIRCIRVGEDE